MSNNFFRPASYYFICDVCGFKFHKEEMKIRWDNMVTCKGCWEPRHPQDFLRAREDRQSVPISRPRSTDIYIQPNYYGNAVAGVAIAGQATAGSQYGTLT